MFGLLNRLREEVISFLEFLNLTGHLQQLSSCIRGCISTQDETLGKLYQFSFKVCTNILSLR